MKHILKFFPVLLAVLFLLSVFAGCGERPKIGAKGKDDGNAGQENTLPEEASASFPETTSGEDTPENYLDLTGVDFSSPAIVIAADDYDGMFDFAKKMQNYEIPQGTIVEISGFAGPGMMTHTIDVPNAAGSQSVGTTYEVVGDVDFPTDNTPIHIIGVVRIGEYYPLIVVPAELYEPMG